METKLIRGLSQVYSKYDAFFIDLWGVIHNGIELYPGAIEVLENLNKLNKRFVLISNAPRPSKSVEKYLLKLKMDKSFIKNVFTSGEAALQTLKKNSYGKKFYHIGPKRDNDLIEGLEKNKTSLDKCEFILCTGLFEDKENSIDYYKNLLRKYIKKKMICTNKESILVVGDNLRTDILGANNMNFDSLFITNGIHRDEFLNLPVENYDKILEKYKTKTNYYQAKLTW